MNVLRSLRRIFKPTATGIGIIGYGTGLYLIYDSYQILSEYKQDLKIFDPMSDRLICKGTYQYSRNPMYLGGLLTISCGWILTLCMFPVKSIVDTVIHVCIGSVLFGSFFYLNYYIIPYEECKCLEKYGDQYKEYQ
eukprot:296816_1